MNEIGLISDEITKIIRDNQFTEKLKKCVHQFNNILVGWLFRTAESIRSPSLQFNQSSTTQDETRNTKPNKTYENKSFGQYYLPFLQG